MYSMMRKSCLGVSMISYSWMMLGCRISFRMWISRDTRSTSATSIIFSFSRIFIATFSPVGMCVADFTFPNVPFPSVFPASDQPYRSRSCRWSWTSTGPATAHAPRWFRSLSESFDNYIGRTSEQQPKRARRVKNAKTAMGWLGRRRYDGQMEDYYVVQFCVLGI